MKIILRLLGGLLIFLSLLVLIVSIPFGIVGLLFGIFLIWRSSDIAAEKVAEEAAAEQRNEIFYVETFVEESTPEYKAIPEEHIKSLNFVGLKMKYTKANSYEPGDYTIRVKDLTQRDGLYYIKAIKEGERQVKHFRVDRIESLTMNGIEIADPLSFFLKGEISTDF